VANAHADAPASSSQPDTRRATLPSRDATAQHVRRAGEHAPLTGRAP
jgi:hypothetical protein